MNSIKLWFAKKSDQKQTWAGANEDCKSYGMKSVTFDSNHEQNMFLHACKLQRKRQLWIGYTDVNSFRNWHDEDGDRANVDLDFMRGEPSNAGGNEHCIHISEVGEKYQCNDLICTSLQNVVCELTDNSDNLVKNQTCAACPTCPTFAACPICSEYNITDL